MKMGKRQKFVLAVASAAGIMVLGAAALKHFTARNGRGERRPARYSGLPKAAREEISRDHVVRGGALIEEGRYKEAVVEGSKAIEANPDSRGAYMILAEAHQRMGGYSQTIEASCRILELSKTESGGTDVTAMYNHICFLELGGKRDEAIALLEDYCGKFPDSKGPPFFLPLERILKALKEVKGEHLYSRWTIPHWLNLHRDKPVQEQEIIKFLERHLEVFPEGKEYIVMLKEGKGIEYVIAHISVMMLEGQLL